MSERIGLDGDSTRTGEIADGNSSTEAVSDQLCTAESQGNQAAPSDDDPAPALGLTLETVLRSLIPFGSFERVVEVGCGSGALAEWISRAIPDSGTVRAFDVDPRRVRQARRSREGNEPEGRVVYRKGDVYRLSGSGEPADLVICKRLLSVLKHPERAVERMVEQTRPAGHVAAIEPAAPQHFHVPEDGAYERSSEDMHQAFERGWRERGVDQRVGLRVPEMFIRAGVDDLSVEGVVDVHAVADHRRTHVDVQEQLRAEAAAPDPATVKLLREGGMTVDKLEEHCLRAKDRLQRFERDPEGFRRSGYVRLMSPLLVTVGRRRA